jgi:hypothetical protein
MGLLLLFAAAAVAIFVAALLYIVFMGPVCAALGFGAYHLLVRVWTRRYPGYPRLIEVGAGLSEAVIATLVFVGVPALLRCLPKETLDWLLESVTRRLPPPNKLGL